MINKNDILELEIIDFTDKGFGVGKVEGVPVFVPSAAVGDTLSVKILKAKKNIAFGKIEEIIKPSKDRITPDCPVFYKCGGCAYRHINYESELKIKQNQVYNCIKRIGGIDLFPNKIIGAHSPLRYRNKAQFPISSDGKVGFYSPRSHRIIPCGDCLLQPKSFAKAVKVFEDWIQKTNPSIYDEESGKGFVRHLYLRSSADENIMVVVVINGDSLPFADHLVSALKSVLGNQLKSIQININKAKTNVILSEKCITLYGDETLADTLCGVTINLSPLSFYQVNRNMAEVLYNKAKEYAKPQDKTVLDLYCGAGTIGLSMAREAKRIIGVEIIPQAVENAILNAENSGFSNTEFICADAADAAKQLKEKGLRPDVVIVDPPRRGCEISLIKTIAEDFCPERVVYVSCDPATLARDVAIFKHLGYKLEEYTPIDLFPRTTHVETVCLLSRKQ